MKHLNKILWLVLFCMWVGLTHYYFNLWRESIDMQEKIVSLERDVQVMQDTYNGLYLENTELKDSIVTLNNKIHVPNNE